MHTDKCKTALDVGTDPGRQVQPAEDRQKHVQAKGRETAEARAVLISEQNAIGT